MLGEEQRVSLSSRITSLEIRVVGPPREYEVEGVVDVDVDVDGKEELINLFLVAKGGESTMKDEGSFHPSAAP